jgi:hypothetical protein
MMMMMMMMMMMIVLYRYNFRNDTIVPVPCFEKYLSEFWNSEKYLTVASLLASWPSIRSGWLAGWPILILAGACWPGFSLGVDS